MKPTFKTTHLLPLLTAGIYATLAPAQDAPATKKENPPLSADEIKLAQENTLLPMPGEVLTTLAKAGDAKWKELAGQLQGAGGEEPSDDATRAVSLGTSVAEAFVAVQAQDDVLLSTLSQRILRLARQLGASEPLLATGEKITERAKAGAWAEVLPLLDEVQGETITALEELGDKDSATLALAAGWLRGTQLFATAAEASYSKAVGSALRQGDLVDGLLSRMANLSDKTKETASAQAIQKGLEAVKPLVSVAQDAEVSQEAVTKIIAGVKDALLIK